MMSKGHRLFFNESSDRQIMASLFTVKLILNLHVSDGLRLTGISHYKGEKEAGSVSGQKSVNIGSDTLCCSWSLHSPPFLFP